MEKPPDSSKRYSLSQEEFAKERIRGIKAAIKKMKSERPEIVSATLFGSLVKGATREDSDIDMVVYLDADKVAEEYADKGETVTVDKKWNFNSRRGGEVQAGTFSWKDLRKDIEDEYVLYFRLKIKEELQNLSDEQLKHVIPYVISRNILDESLDAMLNSYKKYPNGAKSEVILLKDEPIVEGEEARTESEASRIEPNQVLYSMFFLSVVEGMKPYRKYVINKLLEEGEVGEAVWNDLIRSTEGWEQRMSFYKESSDKRYPRTLKEAQKVYG